MVPRQTQRKGVYRPIASSADPPCVHCEGLMRASQEIVTLRRGDAAARAVIGPLTKSPRRTKAGSRLRRSVCVVLALTWNHNRPLTLVMMKQSIHMVDKKFRPNHWSVQIGDTDSNEAFGLGSPEPLSDRCSPACPCCSASSSPARPSHFCARP